jgi:hypothetical protein
MKIKINVENHPFKKKQVAFLSMLVSFALLIYEKKIYMWKGDIILIPSQPNFTLFP